ncbi:bifunctional folylpolyglutamate synthase/dihydrofolate synthase [Alteribacillus sp. HJP-4]|uniref:bifunctional folylpolyglutamate synthase/dihydrofolate synthase n=1 Tax=Alteribacillus sp. HJP-4 TaxID=2775394 RepID=UPI0035CCF180
MNTYEEAREWLTSFTSAGVRPGLERVTMMLEGIGNPERRLKSIHVGGTNGKGSTVTFLKKPMEEAGIVCGTFTSPYVNDFRERISVNSEPISKQDFLECTQAVKPVAESIARTPFGIPTEFEVLTVIAAHYFRSKAFPDVVIWEVGLGGRLDSTNAMHPMISVITNVGHDHQQFLGDKIEEIAYEKAGIIKSGVPLVTCEQRPEPLAVMEKEIENNRTKMYRLGHEFSVSGAEPAAEGWSFSFHSLLTGWKDLRIAMLGEHQTKNAAAALFVLRYLMMYYALPVDEAHIRSGLEKAFWPGRLELLKANETAVLLDGAHNPEGMESLAQALAAHFPEKTLSLIVGMTKEKKPQDILAPLQQFDNVKNTAAVTYDFPRAASAEEVASQSPLPNTKAYHSWQQAFDEALQQSSPDTLIVFAGSLYFISEVRGELVGDKNK